MTVAFNSVLNM